MQDKPPGQRQEEQFGSLSDSLPIADDRSNIREQSGSTSSLDKEILEDFRRIAVSGAISPETAFCGCISSCECANCQCISKGDSSAGIENTFEDPPLNSSGQQDSPLQTLYQSILDEALGVEGQQLTKEDVEQLANELFSYLKEQ